MSYGWELCLLELWPNNILEQFGKSLLICWSLTRDIGANGILPFSKWFYIFQQILDFENFNPEIACHIDQQDCQATRTNMTMMMTMTMMARGGGLQPVNPGVSLASVHTLPIKPPQISIVIIAIIINIIFTT